MTFVLLTALAVSVSFPPASHASPRTWQPVTLKARTVPSLVGTRIGSLELLALHGGVLQPVPFQVDERLPDGRYAMPAGPESVADDSPGILDDDDEIAAMISDLGPRALNAAGMPADAVEIQVADPLGDAPRYAYLASVKRPRLSPTNYIEYDPALHRIESDRYRIGFANDLPVDFALQSRKRTNAPNLLDRFKVRVSAKVLKFFTFTLNEDDLDNRLLAWKEGPIRVIRRIQHSVRLILGIRSPEVISRNFFYRDYIENPFTIKFPWIPGFLFGDIRVRLSLDFVHLRDYSLYWSGMEGPPLAVGRDGAPSSRRDALAEPDVAWIALRGGGRVMVQAMAPAPEFERIERRLYYRETPDDADPPERLVGQDPGVGYLMTGWERLSGGTHHLVSLLMTAPDDYRPARLMMELRDPPALIARPVLDHQPTTDPPPHG